MNAQFDYDGGTHTFQVSLGPRPDGRIGPPLEVIVDDLAPQQYAPKRKPRRSGSGAPAVAGQTLDCRRDSIPD